MVFRIDIGWRVVWPQTYAIQLDQIMVNYKIEKGYALSICWASLALPLQALDPNTDNHDETSSQTYPGLGIAPWLLHVATGQKWLIVLNQSNSILGKLLEVFLLGSRLLRWQYQCGFGSMEKKHACMHIYPNWNLNHNHESKRYAQWRVCGYVVWNRATHHCDFQVPPSVAPSLKLATTSNTSMPHRS